MRSAMIGGIRWAYRSEAWNPTKQEWIQGLSCVQPEEKERIQKFVFKKDAKSSLIGRLFMRKAISEVMSIPYTDVKLGRTEKGKPVLENQVTDPRLKSFSFNISHQGDFTVLAAEQCRQVGIDVMKTVYPSGTNVPDFFQLMRKQFTPAEWLTVKREKTERDQLEMFYRHWCLKESYVKAVGVGIGHDLQAIEFKLQTPKLSKETITCDSSLCLNGQRVDNWTFEETKLDDSHQVAVAVGPITNETISSFAKKTEFQILTFTELISNAVSIRQVNEDDWETFALKRETRVK